MGITLSVLIGAWCGLSDYKMVAVINTMTTMMMMMMMIIAVFVVISINAEGSTVLFRISFPVTR